MKRDQRPDEPDREQAYSLYDTEERVLEQTEEMLRKLEDVGGGVRSLARAYRQGYEEQKRLVRLSDRMQLELQGANRRLAQQANQLMELNASLQNEVEERERLSAELRRLASEDFLTGAVTRRHLFELAQRERKLHERDGRPMGLLVMDLDEFKRMNDGQSHAAGDQALVELVSLCNALLRDVDILGRIGGDEFAVVLPDADLECTAETAERIRQALAEHPGVRHADGSPCTISIGVAEHQDGDSIHHTLGRADKAMYQAKRQGGNRVLHDTTTRP